MPVRGEQHRKAIGAVLDAFGEDTRHFVFVGASVLGLYARPTGTPLRATAGVDCISTRTPWVLQEKLLGDLCTQGVIAPDRKVQCRYRIKKSGLDVDILSPEGWDVGGVNYWFPRACTRAKTYPLGDGRTVTAISPPFFLATKLVAFEDRGPDAQSSKDVEDIVALAVEASPLVEQVDAEGVRSEVAALWIRALGKYGRRVADIPDLVDWHIGRDDREQVDRVVKALGSLASSR